MAHDLTVRLDPTRHRKLIRLANEHRLSPHDLVAKALDAFFAAPIK
jgi:predicted transcriptional regulator